MQDFILDIEVKVTAKPVNAKVGTTQRGPYERNLFVVRESVKKSYTGLKGDIATMAANAVKPISQQWPLGVAPPAINTITGANPLAATTATLNANVTDGPVTGFATAAAALVVAATAGTITRPAGSWLDDGFREGMEVTFADFTNAGNNAAFVIASLTDTVITVVDNTGLVDETGGGDETATIGSETGVFVEWGSDKAALTLQPAEESPISSETATAVTCDLTSLTAETQYYYRWGVAAKGVVVRSQLKTFTTPAA